MEGVALLSHDLRQSIAVIVASASAAAEDPDLSPEARRWLQHISDEAQRISRICEHAVTAEGAPQTLRLLNDVALGVIDSLGALTFTAIAFRPAEEDIEVDGAAVERALVNIVGNACGAAGRDGRVHIEIHSESHGRLIITVDDSGTGFTEESDEHVGLGLSSTRRVLASLGGSLRISKRGPLGGARVELLLPFDSQEQTAKGAA